MNDKRHTARKKTFLTAYASPGAGRVALPCLVRDLSRSGARLIMAGAERLPEIFEVHINGRDRVLQVETKWRTATEIGVRLLAKVPLPASLPNDAPLRPAIHVDAGKLRA